MKKNKRKFRFGSKINTAFSQLYRAQIFECAWLDFEARKNPLIGRLVLEKKFFSR